MTEKSVYNSNFPFLVESKCGQKRTCLQWIFFARIRWREFALNCNLPILLFYLVEAISKCERKVKNEPSWLTNSTVSSSNWMNSRRNLRIIRKRKKITVRMSWFLDDSSFHGGQRQKLSVFLLKGNKKNGILRILEPEENAHCCCLCLLLFFC